MYSSTISDEPSRLSVTTDASHFESTGGNMSAQLDDAAYVRVCAERRQALQSLTEEELIVACQRRDSFAFDMLVKRYSRYIDRLLFRLAPDWSSAHDDLRQEVFVRVWKALETLENPRAFRTWLCQIATNIFHDELRKHSRMRVCSMDELLHDGDGESWMREIPDVKQQPDEIYHCAEIERAVRTAVNTLPDHYKNVVLLRDFHGMAYEDIAELTDSELGTVKSRISRGRARIQEQLAHLQCA